MRNKRKGIDISTKTFRVLPDDLVKMWWTRELDAIELMVWLSLQLIAVEKGRATFTEIHRICRVSRAKLSASLKKLQELGLLVRNDNSFVVVYEPRGSQNEPVGSRNEPRGSQNEPVGSQNEPQLSSNRRGELKRDIESHGDSRETPTPRCAASLERLSSSNGGGASADSHIHISDSDLALLAQRYGIHLSNPVSEPVAVMIRGLLNGNLGEGTATMLRKIAARCRDFAGAAATAPDELNTTVGG